MADRKLSPGFDYSYDTKINPLFSILLLTQRIEKPKLLRIVYVLCTSAEFHNMARTVDYLNKKLYSIILFQKPYR